MDEMIYESRRFLATDELLINPHMGFMTSQRFNGDKLNELGANNGGDWTERNVEEYMRKITEIELTDDEFLRMTRYCNAGDNQADNRRRAVALGFESPGVSVAPGAIIRLNSAGFIEKNVFIGLYCYINGAVKIEENTLIGPGCALTAGQHKFDPKTNCFSARTEADGDESITIGRGSWLCAHVTITPGVKIGRANLICAGAVVTRSTSDYAIMAGIPAREVGRICPETGAYHWYNSKTRIHEEN